MGDDSARIVLETAKSLDQPTVSQLIDELTKQKGFKSKEATKAVYTEYKKGNLDLAPTTPPKNFAGYFFSSDNIKLTISSAMLTFVTTCKPFQPG